LPSDAFLNAGFNCRGPDHLGESDIRPERSQAVRMPASPIRLCLILDGRNSPMRSSRRFCRVASGLSATLPLRALPPGKLDPDGECANTFETGRSESGSRAIWPPYLPQPCWRSSRTPRADRFRQAEFPGLIELWCNKHCFAESRSALPRLALRELVHELGEGASKKLQIVLQSGTGLCRNQELTHSRPYGLNICP